MSIPLSNFYTAVTLWFTDENSNRIFQMTTSGTLNAFTPPTPNSAPYALTVGPDGNIWFIENGNNAIGKLVVDAKPIPVPTGQQFFVESPVVTPVINPVPALAEPIGIGSIAASGSLLNLLIGLGQFSAPVDIYFAISAPAIDPINIYILTPTGLQTFASTGLVPWVTNTLGSIYIPLFKNISLSQLPAGTYTLYLGVAPTGATDAYYLWQTTFTR